MLPSDAAPSASLSNIHGAYGVPACRVCTASRVWVYILMSLGCGQSQYVSPRLFSTVFSLHMLQVIVNLALLTLKGTGRVDLLTFSEIWNEVYPVIQW